MFLKGFKKTATKAYIISPEDLYELESEAYPHAGANVGAVGGALAGAAKGAKGKKSKSALVGGAVGGLAGGVAGAAAGKGVKAYKLHRLHVAANRLRSIPTRHQSHEE